MKDPIPLKRNINIINKGINDMKSGSLFMKLPSNNGFIIAAKDVSVIACIIMPIIARIKMPL